MAINPHIFRAYDIRGIAEASNVHPTIDLTQDSMRLIGWGIGTYLQKTYPLHIVVGRDNRLTGKKLQKALIEGLIEAGCNVTDIGLSTSPMLYFAVCKYGFDGGINITASHNPKEYNGLKIVGKGGHSICGDEIQTILKMIQDVQKNKTALQNSRTTQKNTKTIKAASQQNLQTINNRKLSTQAYQKKDITEDYFNELEKNIKACRVSSPSQYPSTLAKSYSSTKSLQKSSSINRKPFNPNLRPFVTDNAQPRSQMRPLKVVIDAGNGTTGKFAKNLFERFGHKVTELYCELDGSFPNHEANPEELKNMKALIAKVKKIKADIGIGFDGDGDRIGMVDEKGNFYAADYLLIMLARDVLSRHKGAKIIYDLKSSLILIEDMKKHGGIPIMARTGHSFVEQLMKKEGALLGGEVSGHMFFAENYYGFDDAFLAGLKILEILKNSGKKLSEHFKNLPKTFITPEIKAPCSDEKKFEIVKKVTKHFQRSHKCITIDGVRIDFGDEAWGIVRSSNTSPYLTLRFEAKTREKFESIQKEAFEALSKYSEVDCSWFKKI